MKLCPNTKAKPTPSFSMLLRLSSRRTASNLQSNTPHVGLAGASSHPTSTSHLGSWEKRTLSKAPSRQNALAELRALGRLPTVSMLVDGACDGAAEASQPAQRSSAGPWLPSWPFCETNSILATSDQSGFESRRVEESDVQGRGHCVQLQKVLSTSRDTRVSEPNLAKHGPLWNSERAEGFSFPCSGRRVGSKLVKGGLRLRSRLQADLELRDVKPISDFVLAEGLIENVDL